MQYKYICPFCKGLFKQNEVHPHKATCVTCDLELNGVTKTISLGYTSPQYIRDTYTFIEEFLKRRPHLAFGRHELYSPSFNVDEVFVFTDKTTSLKRADDTLDAQNVVDNFHIIGAEGRLTHGIVADTYNSLLFGVDQNPFVWNVQEDAEHLVFKHMLLQYQHKDIPSIYRLVVNTYFRATLEARIQDLYMPFKLFAPLPNIDDEHAIYSMLMNKPHVTIGWESNVSKLMLAEERYVECLLKDLDKVEVPESIALSHYLLSMPSTAINGGKSAFDILNNEFVKPQECNLITEILTDIFKKYTREEQQLGYSFKVKYLGDDLIEGEDVVLQFWKKVKENIN